MSIENSNGSLSGSVDAQVLNVTLNGLSGEAKPVMTPLASAPGLTLKTTRGAPSAPASLIVTLSWVRDGLVTVMVRAASAVLGSAGRAISGAPPAQPIRTTGESDNVQPVQRPHPRLITSSLA